MRKTGNKQPKNHIKITAIESVCGIIFAKRYAPLKYEGYFLIKSSDKIMIDRIIDGKMPTSRNLDGFFALILLLHAINNVPILINVPINKTAH